MTTATATETKSKTKLTEMKMWNVMLKNDDYTPFHFVIEVLVQLFHKDEATANVIATAIHNSGKGHAGGPYTKEVATQKAHDVMQIARKWGHPLVAVAEEA
jgi:ATP-dependent Clp protease adaptor protein ClpS